MSCCQQPIAYRRSPARGMSMDEFRVSLRPIPMYEPPAQPYTPRGSQEPLHAGHHTVPCRGPVRPRPAADPHREPVGIRRAACSTAKAKHGGEAMEQARVAAERSLRVALEVLDRRRALSQLDALADSSTVAAVRTLVRADLVPSRELGAAVLAVVHIVMVDERSAEICARYLRGSRRLALAARIERCGPRGWRLTALRIS
nr:Rv3235 family protein [Nocardia cyriacigeorgica]